MVITLAYKSWLISCSSTVVKHGPDAMKGFTSAAYTYRQFGMRAAVIATSMARENPVATLCV